MAVVKLREPRPLEIAAANENLPQTLPVVARKEGIEVFALTFVCLGGAITVAWLAFLVWSAGRLIGAW